MNVALSPLNCIALCAGVGGLDLGVSLALPHARTVCYVEREAAAAASLVASMEAGWFHPAAVWSDMRTFDAGSWRGAVDLVTSGDPCQGNSVAGKRLGQLDDRWLLDRAIDIFDASGARYFFRENVPGNADGQLAVAIPALERLGCRVASGIFSSSETGNTMRRERLFILAERPCDARGLYPRSGRPRQPAADSGRHGGGMDGPSSGRYGHQNEAIWAGRDGTVDASNELVSAAHQRHERGGPARQRRDRPADAGSPVGIPFSRSDSGIATDAGRGSRGRTIADGASTGDESVGGAMLAELQGQQRGQHHPAGWQVKTGPVALPGGTGVRSGHLPPAVIPGPTDRRWIDVLDRYPELQPALSQEEAESHLRRGIDALANRVERLRATGNGVDPVVAAYAFIRLSARLQL